MIVKKQLLHYYAWLFGSLVFSITAQIIFPDYIGFFLSLGIFIALPLIIKYVMGKKLRDAGIFTGFNDFKLVKICTVCGKKAKGKAECPRCGSHQFKMQ